VWTYVRGENPDKIRKSLLGGRLGRDRIEFASFYRTLAAADRGSRAAQICRWRMPRSRPFAASRSEAGNQDTDRRQGHQARHNADSVTATIATAIWHADHDGRPCDPRPWCWWSAVFRNLCLKLCVKIERTTIKIDVTCKTNVPALRARRPFRPRCSPQGRAEGVICFERSRVSPASDGRV